MLDETLTMRVLQLGPHLLGFYDGRVPGRRYHSPEPNWLDDGGYALGICSYAVVDGPSAIVYDTHLSLAHARFIRRTLEARGVRDIRVVLSHWHLDHVAGNAVFDDCEIIACEETARLLSEKRAAIEAGALDSLPEISPLVMPTTTFSGGLELRCGDVEIELRPLDIHSRDGVSMYFPKDGTLLAGDTLEDTVTYVDEPERLQEHLVGLAAVATWEFSRILPNHGSPERIAGAGYDTGLIDATRIYVEHLLAAAADERSSRLPLRTLLAEPLARGSITYFEPYEAVHKMNVDKVRRQVSNN
ncbi:MBL fold metallo-hydrolase [Hyphomicrobium sp. 99]|uniref:MBL fold metallo-hydrolase n=1 Tax=Hyphomicrobium sp. 99 TaxID=1163419 RepID=UPI0005F80051|nr:MBL fold metallo-hydrolase [Hyphomicrobium sp. 99]